MTATTSFSPEERFHLRELPFERSPDFGINPVKMVLERDEAGEFGDEQMRRAHDLLRNMRQAVSKAMRRVDDVATLVDGSPVPLASVQLFASLLESFVGAKTSQLDKSLDRRLPLVAFIHEVIGAVYQHHAAHAAEHKVSAALLRMLTNLATLVSWAFFTDSAKAVAKTHSIDFAASLSRTTIMGLRRTSAIETIDPNFTAASTRTNVLHESLHEAFLVATSGASAAQRLASYYIEAISVPVFEDGGATSPSRGHVQLTRWFLTLANLAEESEEALVAALLQEIDFAGQHLIQGIAEHFEDRLGMCVVDRAARAAGGSGSPVAVRRRLERSDADQAARVVQLVHPMHNEFGRVIDAVAEVTQLLRPMDISDKKKKKKSKTTASSSSDDDDDDDDDDDEDSFINKFLAAATSQHQQQRKSHSEADSVNWSHNLIVHRLASGVVALLLERFSASVVDALSIMVENSENPRTDEALLLRGDCDAHFLKSCISLLERAVVEQLGLDDGCVEALLPLRELNDALALPAECFENEGVFYSVLPKPLIRGIVFEQVVDEIPALEPRQAHDCSVIDLVSCGDLMHGCSNTGLRVESNGELATLRWDNAEYVDAVTNASAAASAAGDVRSAEVYRRLLEQRRVAVAKTFSEFYRGVGESCEPSGGNDDYAAGAAAAAAAAPNGDDDGDDAPEH